MTSSINSSTTAAALALFSNSSTKPKSPIDVAANLFGMSKSDLATELKSGKSLADVAKEKGVSSDDLTSALAANDPSSASSADKLTRGQDLANTVGLTDRPHRARSDDTSTSTSDASSSSSSGTSLLDQLSSLLNTDSTTLTSQLKSGTSLSTLLSNSGVSLNSLASTVQQGLLYDQNL